MFKLRQNIDTDSVSNENAIVFCNDQVIVQNKTYREVLDMSELVIKVISKYIIDDHICLGLLMNHNVYIPSIILSLLELKHAFVFLTAKNLHKSLESLKLQWILSLDDIQEIPSFGDVHKFKVDTETNLILWRSHLSVSTNYNYSNIFCVVQTSGSTGESKMIKVSNSCIESNVIDLMRHFHLTSKDLIYWATPLSFDPSLIELLLALYSKATLVIVPYNISINPNKLYKALTNIAKITFLQMVPSVFLRWDENQIKNILNSAGMRILALGGESFPNIILTFERGNTLRIFNLYGITELSCWASIHEIKDENYDDQIPIGKNLDETILELRDENSRVVTKGKGVIFIGSSTRICYLDDEIQGEKKGVVFRESGDIAEINEKGIFLVGRKNKVIKRFGHRVNLNMVETNVFKETGLRSKCIWSRDKHKIVMFVLIRNLDKQVKVKTIDKLRVKLLNVIPKQSFPDLIEIVENFPLMFHGKVDETALEKFYSVPKTNLNIVDTFSQFWCKYLGYSSETLDQIKCYNFFEMGGNSISALQLIAEFKDSINYECPEQLVTMIFENSLKDCLEYLKSIKPTRMKHIDETVIEKVQKKSKIEIPLKILWSYDFKACIDATPLVFEKRGLIFVTCGSFSRIFAVLNETGNSIFKKIFRDSIESTPILSPCGNFLLLGCFNGIFYCIDFINSETIWEFVTNSQIKSSACLCRNQSAVIFGSYDKTIYCVSLGGLNLWQTVLDGSIASNLIYDQTSKTIFTATTAGTCFCLNEDRGKILWIYKCGGPVFGSPCLVRSDERIVFPEVQGTLHCLAAKTGQLLWTFKADGNIFSSVRSYKEYLIFGCHDSNVYILEHVALGCVKVATIPLSSKISSTPFIFGNIRGSEMIVSACNSGVVSVIDFKTYCILYSIELPGQIFSSPVVYNDKIYIGCRDNNLYCLEIGNEKESV